MKTRLISRLIIVSASLSVILACDFGTITNTNSSTPTTVSTIPAQTTNVSYGNVSLVIPDGLATNALTGTVPALTDSGQWSPWDIAPQYTRIVLDHYALCCSSHEAEIRVYPAQAYAEASPTSVSENIQRLQAILQNGASLTAENMPSVPFFNAGQVLAAQMQVVSFKDGSGVRLVTQYANGIAPASNAGLFYHFQGLTSNGKYYLIAILPI